MNQEPVAWLRKYGDGTWFADTQDHSKTEVCIPLYTHPLKELSDEEIISMFEYPDDFNCIDFARAIEERHGIK